jgi:hypothetical protein
MLERFTGVNENVLAFLCQSLIKWPVRSQTTTAAAMSSMGFNWVARIIVVGVWSFVYGWLLV